SITDLNNLFNPVTGIYVNAREDGENWERECSVELINPDGSQGFGANAGLRIRGGFSRAPEFAKHSFRLLFKAAYGDAKLHFPLFGDEGVDRFDNIDLRTAQNYAWSNGDSRNTMVKEVFSRDSQRDMGQPYTRSRYSHLYLNGMYWGLYQTQERSEADFAAAYFNGSSDDYDVVKVEALIYDIHATDGNLTSWRNIYYKTQAGFENNKDYFELEGRDENGNPIPGATSWIEMDNLIDYMLVIFYSGNWDGPVSEPLRNKQPNNFYAIYSKEDRSEGYRFFSHDAEHSLLGAYDNRVNLADRTDGNNMIVNEFKEFHPQWLHYKLSMNSEYRQRFTDRAFIHLNDAGALSPAEALKRFNDRVSQIDTAIIAESARWGDGRGISEPYTKNDNWLPEINKMQENYFPVRTSVVVDQLKRAGLYSDLLAPLVESNNIPIHDSFYEFLESTSFTLSNPNSLGVLYFTSDATDPRDIGGGISSNALISEDGNTPVSIIHTSILKARVYDKGNWGPLKQVCFMKTDED
ncbi:MAG: CotH kinase family protein, partial [Spirochaetaceae bacterium]|nr:CotH kinase family protein [Spirochaetaceae bacterium]